jgi:hypothetical protein
MFYMGVVCFSIVNRAGRGGAGDGVDLPVDNALDTSDDAPIGGESPDSGSVGFAVKG